MLDSEVRQLELLSAIDALRRRVEEWIDQPSDWESVRRSQLLLRRVMDRVETLRIRMEAPLVVATFGGTGTGKSTLVNALVGEDVTRTGRQRPTTQRPVLITHTQTSPASLGLPLDEVDVVQREADLLRDVVLLDCPDPDTSEGDAPGSNLDRLRTLLPYCDVLLYVSTQQKYRSARVADELKTAASGCRIIFVQTHADLDEDIRHDWQQTLADEYQVPEVFFVDSVKGMQEQLSGRRPSGDMGRLIDLLLNKLGASERVRVRRANVLEMLLAGLSRCQAIIKEKQPSLLEINKVLAAQQLELSRRMAVQLQTELLGNHRLWERRLIASVIDEWGLSPFSCVLRIYNGLGNLLASTMLFRAHSTAQLALLGTVQSVRWFENRRKEQAAESTLQRLGQASLDDSLLREAEIVIRGHVSTAGLSSELLRNRSLTDLRHQAVDVEAEFLGDASRRIDDIIHEQSLQNSRWWIRIGYEVVLSAYLVFVLFRVGKNFFYDSLLYDTHLLTTDFYLAATLFLVLICGVLIVLFTRRLQRGLKTRIRALTDRMVETRLGHGLFPSLEEAVRLAQRQSEELNSLAAETESLRTSLADFSSLGGRQT
ncbi:dynamin family protein [Planctomicrobium piriforme]|uniref:Dynamin family protein n=1 Tax=Planctomicrobium piriforme TaxID=1576369 RepID=A0A1I3QWX7_9PLAN|nr:dynamin family protein [Planctomicrobium piriforme]SFJ38405.1 Dynamin family protein [Planctomicrobium piriforme]